YVCRLLRHMRATGAVQATPRIGAAVEQEAFLDFTSGYVQRAKDILPQQGTRAPWRLDQNYLKDVRTLRYGPIDDEMEFR
ncbi:MAG TPA: FAD-containing monooxygenase EthA, partial [Sphingomonas sp.]|nr:FAD-containing monooxygenase EthA [Sphingomonas sp.]